jgi:hypothetical protein
MMRATAVIVLLAAAFLLTSNAAQLHASGTISLFDFYVRFLHVCRDAMLVGSPK